KARGYAFDEGKIGPARNMQALVVTGGQMEYECEHLLSKLKARSPALHQKWQHTEERQAHPIFAVIAGDVEPWERR
ncbi:MAG TPA: DNA lyase, partial [Burkholderiales bacterium]|nr:DNA lyase [Burkholderiales bacterium]